MSIDISYRTLRSNSMRYMMQYVEEYELVKAKKHPEYVKVSEFFKARKIGFQNFYKFYRRYQFGQRNPNNLLPLKRGPKPKYQEMPLVDEGITKKVLEYRQLGFNKFYIADILKRDGIKKGASASTIYRIFCNYGVSKLNKTIHEEKRKIIRTFAGSLGHADCHYLPKGIVKAEPDKKYFVVGVIDDFSRVVWVEVIQSVKAVDATFATLDILMLMNKRYGIQFGEMLTDNGPEFCSNSTKPEQHVFERLLLHFSIKHRRTQPYRPQTNGKIERFWKTFDDEVIEGAVFNTLDELKNAVLGYNFYYNENRPHQGLNGKIPSSMLEKNLDK